MAQISGTEPITNRTDLRGTSQRRGTTAASDASLATTSFADSYGWSDVCDTLLKWLADPLDLEDDGIDAPTEELIESALAFSSFFGLRENNPVPAPTSVAPTPDGGISFEWRMGADLEIAEIVEVGKAEYTIIRGATVALDELLCCTLDGQWIRVER